MMKIISIIKNDNDNSHINDNIKILTILMILTTIIFVTSLAYQFPLYFLRLCLNVIRLVDLLISSGILFHNVRPIETKGILTYPIFTERLLNFLVAVS